MHWREKDAQGEGLILASTHLVVETHCRVIRRGGAILLAHYTDKELPYYEVSSKETVS